jgi:hypothetical protein
LSGRALFDSKKNDYAELLEVFLDITKRGVVAD